MQPLVTIVIPCYNQGKWLHEAIDSALAQCYKNIEVIVINDGSTDNTKDVALSYKDRITYIEQTNRGLSYTRNIGITQSKGEYILPLDSDDKLDPLFVERTLPIIAQNPKIGYVYTDTVCFDDQQKEKPYVTCLDWSWTIERLLTQNVGSSASLFRKSDWQIIGGYCVAFTKGFEDWDFWLSIADLGKVGHYLKEPLMFYRQHLSGSMRQVAINEYYYECYSLLVKRHEKLFAENCTNVLLYWVQYAEQIKKGWIKYESLYWKERPGRLEWLGVPLVLARLIRKIVNSSRKYFKRIK